jgi:hypothetical protein
MGSIIVRGREGTNITNWKRNGQDSGGGVLEFTVVLHVCIKLMVRLR